MTLQELLRSYGVTDPSQLQYRDASAGMGDFSRADLADAGYSSRGGAPSAGLSGWSTPNGGYIPAGDIARDGHTVYSMGQGVNGPNSSSHVDSPDLNMKDLALMVAMTFGGAFGMEALGGLMGAGGAAADGALVSGMDLAADGAMSGANALPGFGAGGANGLWDVLPNAVSPGAASNGMWDVLPEAFSGAPNTATMGAGAESAAGAANGSWDILPPEVAPPGSVVPPVAGSGGGPLSKAALDGTNAFGANSVANAYELAPGATLSSTIPSVAPPGSSTGTPYPEANPITDFLKNNGSLIAPLLGGLLGSQPQTSTQKQDIPDWLKPYVIGDSTHTGILAHTNALLDKQMAPGYMQGYEDMRSVGQGLLHTPQVGNQFSQFFPNPSAGYQPQMPTGSPLGAYLPPGMGGMQQGAQQQPMQPQGQGLLMAPRGRARPGIAY